MIVLYLFLIIVILWFISEIMEITIDKRPDSYIIWYTHPIKKERTYVIIDKWT